MTRQQAIEELRVSLTKAIGEWAEKVSEDAAWEEIGYVPGDLERLMATAAITVLEAVADTQEYLEKEGLMKSE